MNKVLDENKDVLVKNIKLGGAFLGGGAVLLIATPIAALGVSVVASAVAIAAAVNTIVLGPIVRKQIANKMRDNNIVEVKSFGSESERQLAVDLENHANNFKKSGSTLLARQVLGLSVLAAASLVTNGGLGVIAGIGTMYLLRDKKLVEQAQQEKKIGDLAKEIRARRTGTASKTATLKL